MNPESNLFIHLISVLHDTEGYFPYYGILMGIKKQGRPQGNPPWSIDSKPSHVLDLKTHSNHIIELNLSV